MGNRDGSISDEELLRIVKEVEAEVRKELNGPPGTLDEIEEEAQRIGERVKAIIERRRLKSKEQDFARDCSACRCGRQARRRGIQVRRVTTLSGVRRIKRPYFYCDRCRRGFYPLDESLALGTGEFSLRVRALASRFAGYVPFEAASRELREVLGLHVSASSIRRIGMGSGRQIQADFAAEQARLASNDCDFQSDRRPKQLHASMDGCMISVRGQWREVKTGVVYQRHPAKEREIACADYYSTLAESRDFGPRVRTLAYINGADRCAAVGVVADGAKWIWQEAAKNLPKAEQIVDLFHAMEYVWTLANARWGAGSRKAAEWAAKQKRSLLNDRVGSVIESMKRWQPSAEEHREIKRTTIGYFAENKKRMRYKTFLEKGWHIGSGVMEAANKAVVQQRMKLSGMRWSEEGAEAMLGLRAAITSSRRVDFKDVANRAKTFA